MPQFLVQIVISIALRFGVPFLLKYFPGLPPGVVQIIEELLGKLSEQKVVKQEAVLDAKKKIATCFGDNCPV